MLASKLVFAALIATSSASGFVACASSQEESAESSHVTQALITSAAADTPIAFSSNKETSVTWTPAGVSPGHWLMASNNLDSNSGLSFWSWAYSSDYSGINWTFKNQTSPLQFGSPPTNSPSDGTAFSGWRSDPSVAGVTDSNWSNYQRAVGVNIAATVGSGGNPSDVIIALSEDSGQNWRNLQWVNDAATGGAAADMPFVFSNPQYPFDTYVSWRGGGTVGHLRQVKYTLPPASSFTPGPILNIPVASGQNGDMNRFNFGFGTLPTGCTSGGEGIFVIYTNDQSRCARSGTREPVGSPIYWNLAVYDTGAGAWLNIGPNNVFVWGTDPNFWNCAGFPLTSSQSNTMDPHIAVDPTSSNFWTIHTQTNTTTGIRAQVDSGYLTCGPGPVVNKTPLWTDPDPPCTGGCTLPDGGPIIHDDWLPSIAMSKQSGVTRVAWNWYGTRDDINNGQAAVYLAYQENGGPIATPTRLTTGAYPVNGSTTWAIGAATDPDDFKTLAANWGANSFLSVWAKDARQTVVPSFNGGFESGDLGGWLPIGAAQSVVSSSTHSGTYAAMLGNVTPTNGDSTIRQTFTTPTSATSVSFWYKMTCPDTVQFDWATATLYDTVAMTTTTVLPQTCSNNSWTQVSGNVVGGRAYTLKLVNHDDNYGADPSFTLYDDIAFSAPVGTTTLMSNLAR